MNAAPANVNPTGQAQVPRPAVDFKDTTLSTLAQTIDLGKSTKVSMSTYKYGTYEGETASLLCISATHITRKSNSATVNYRFELRLDPTPAPTPTTVQKAKSWVYDRLHSSGRNPKARHPSVIKGGDVLPRQEAHSEMTGVPAASNPQVLKTAALDVVVPTGSNAQPGPSEQQTVPLEGYTPASAMGRSETVAQHPAATASQSAVDNANERPSSGPSSAQPDFVLTIGPFGPHCITLPKAETPQTAHHTGVAAGASATGGVPLAQVSAHLDFTSTADWGSPDTQYVTVTRSGETLLVSVSGPGKKGQGIPINITLAVVVVHTVPARLRVFPSTTTPLRSLLTYSKSHLRPHPRKRETFIVTCDGGQGGKECTDLCSRFEKTHMTPNIWRSLLKAGPVDSWSGQWVEYG